MCIKHEKGKDIKAYILNETSRKQCKCQTNCCAHVVVENVVSEVQI